MSVQDTPKLYSWNAIEDELQNMRDVDGGFSQARRGLITMPDGAHVFVKMGEHDNTRRWVSKEIGTYQFLARHSYDFIPKLLATNSDNTGLALQAYQTEEGWDWQDDWDEQRLAKTFEALDALAAIKPSDTDREYFSDKTFNEGDDGWLPLLESEELRSKLIAKMQAAGYADIASSLDFEAEANHSKRFVFASDALVHYDIRGDNCAWNAATCEVRLVDWNWTTLGDRRIDVGATLTHIQKSGFDVLPKYASRLDKDALQWLAGFWFKSAATPIWPGGLDRLRDLQLLAGITALNLQRAI